MTRPTWIGLYGGGILRAETVMRDVGLAHVAAGTMLLFYYEDGIDTAVVGDNAAEYCPRVPPPSEGRNYV